MMALVFPIPEIGKTLERMVNNRLVWYLENKHITTEHQSGFRRRQSTVDNLVILESAFRDFFINKGHLVTVFFDLKKAYDTHLCTRQYCILSLFLIRF